MSSGKPADRMIAWQGENGTCYSISGLFAGLHDLAEKQTSQRFAQDLREWNLKFHQHITGSLNAEATERLGDVSVKFTCKLRIIAGRIYILEFRNDESAPELRTLIAELKGHAKLKNLQLTDDETDFIGIHATPEELRGLVNSVVDTFREIHELSPIPVREGLATAK